MNFTGRWRQENPEFEVFLKYQKFAVLLGYKPSRLHEILSPKQNEKAR